MNSKKIEELDSSKVQLCTKIIKHTNQAIMLRLRFLHTAVNIFRYEISDEAIGTDGEYIYYEPNYLLNAYQKSENYLSRVWVHIILHCAFRNWIIRPTVNREKWNLACDMAVENVIIGMNIQTLTMADDYLKKQEIKKLEVGKLIPTKIYEALENYSDQEVENLSQLFCMDDHRFWYDREPENQEPEEGEDGEESGGIGSSREHGDESNGNQGEEENPRGSQHHQENNRQSSRNEQWEKISQKMQTEFETFEKARGNQSGDLIQNLREVNREKYDYSQFLRKFSVLSETMKINNDEFDYIFYTYGLSQYGNIPLIEPLEYKDEKVVKEFVIAIDTSGSTVGEVVHQFLQKTYNILMQQENFAKKVNIHIIQCDTQVTNDCKITNIKEFESYMKKLKIHGGGGTDFVPVFTYVDELIKRKEINNLGGLVYFTDGYGRFPTKRTNYNTAFAFLEYDEQIIVPSWAYSIVLEPEEWN